MSVKLRLARGGRKKKPYYSIVACDEKSPRDGRFIEKLGFYDPCNEPATINVDADRVKYWYGVGAQPTEKVAELLKIAQVDLSRAKTHKSK